MRYLPIPSNPASLAEVRRITFVIFRGGEFMLSDRIDGSTPHTSAIARTHNPKRLHFVGQPWILFTLLSSCLACREGIADNRVLRFPDERSVGTVSHCEPPTRSGSFLHFENVSSVVGEREHDN